MKKIDSGGWLLCPTAVSTLCVTEILRALHTARTTRGTGIYILTDFQPASAKGT